MQLKQLERAGKALAIWMLARLMAPGARRGPTACAAGPCRVLFLRHDRIGDMILSTGVIRAIAESRPLITVDVLASPLNAPVLREATYVSEVVPFDTRRPSTYLALVRRLRRARYDAVVDCMVTAPSLTTLLLMLASGARSRVGAAGRGIDGALTVAVPPRPGAVHMVERLSALAAAFGMHPDGTGWRPAIALSAYERERAVRTWNDPTARRVRMLVNVSAGRPFRRWPAERYVAVMRHLRARCPEARVRVIGTPDEHERTAEIAHAGGAHVAATPDLRDALALVATADLVVTPDTSIVHAASAFGTPVVAMYVRGTSTAWGLYDTWGATVASEDGTVASLPLAPVLAAIDEVLGYQGADAPAIDDRIARAAPSRYAARRHSDGGREPMSCS